MVFTYCSRISICDAASRFNDVTRKKKVSYLLKELNQLKHSWSWKATTANKMTRNIGSGVKYCNHIAIIEKKEKVKEIISTYHQQHIPPYYSILLLQI